MKNPTPWRLTLPVVPFGVKLSDARAGSTTDPSAEFDAEMTFPAQSTPASRTLELSVSSSLAGGYLRRARIPHLVPVRLHRANHVELLAQRDSDESPRRSRREIQRGQIGRASCRERV